jgi:hypothetical protein
MYTVTEVEQLIVAEWRTWSKQRGSYSGADMLSFYCWLQKDRSHLLLFRCSGDKWQKVRGWLQRDEDIQSKLLNRRA